MPAAQITLDQDVINKLEEFLPEFREGGKKKRRSIVSRLAGETLPQGSDEAKHRKMVKNWFYNYGRNRDKKDKITYVRRWNLNQVVGHMKKAEIQELCKEETGCNPGTKSYLSGYQKALANVREDLSPEEISGFKEMAREWSEKSPPKEVQRKAAETHGGRYVREFCQQMFRQLGMRVLVLSAHHDTNGTLSLAVHDNNPDLDGESMSSVRPGWEEEPVMTEWGKYAKSQMGNDEEEEDSDRDLPTQRKKTKYSFDMDDSGYIILPDPDGEGDMKLAKMEQMIRAFLTIHYQKATGKPNATVPWGGLMGSEAEYVDPEYLPAGFTFKEPSKLSKVEAYARLKFWYDRQEDPKIKRVFQFRRIRGKTGEAELPDRGQEANKKKRTRASQGRKNTTGKKAPHADMDRAVQSESSDSEEDEDGEDEDVEEERAEIDGDNGIIPAEDDPPAKKKRHPNAKASKAPKALPFAAVPVRPQGARIKAVKSSRSRSAPNPIAAAEGAEREEGPSMERPRTRQQKRKALDEEESSPKKKVKRADEITKTGPPRGQKKDKPVEGRGKRKAKH